MPFVYSLPNFHTGRIDMERLFSARQVKKFIGYCGVDDITDIHAVHDFLLSDVPSSMGRRHALAVIAAAEQLKEQPSRDSLTLISAATWSRRRLGL